MRLQKFECLDLFGTNLQFSFYLDGWFCLPFSKYLNLYNKSYFVQLEFMLNKIQHS
jgi:hypothetical protein